MNGTMVRPKKWTNVLDLYDDGEYSAIWGNFDNNVYRSLGVRWNGGKIGYPNQGANPVWYVEPDFLTVAILNQLYTWLQSDYSLGNIQNIKIALKEAVN